jgi:lipid-A-disaccharide synthase
MRVGIVAGEASGDILGSELIRAMKQVDDTIQFEGIGGPLMIEEGCQSFFPMEILSVMGLVEVLKHLPTLLSIQKSIVKHFLKNPPDIFIGIDAPDFNLTIERKLKKKSIKIVHYVSPTIWAWRTYRAHKIAKSVDLILSIFPFEVDFYKPYHVPVTFVGHPLATMIEMKTDTQSARQQLKLDISAPIIALLPGSRSSEIHYLAESFIQTAMLCHQSNPKVQFIVPLASNKTYQQFETILKQFDEFPIQLFLVQSRLFMSAADAMLMASGTATLEALLLKKPMIFAYRISAITHWILKTFKVMKIKYFSMPNLLAQKQIVTEYIQDDIDPVAISKEMLETIGQDENDSEMLVEFNKIHEQLALNSSQIAAEAVFKLIKK